MKAAFGVEAIGLSASRKARYQRIGLEREMYRHWRPWLAELVSVDPRGGYVREFLDPKVDYTNANSAGTRGVEFWWTLTAGRFYETRYPITWAKRVHRFLAVTGDGKIVDTTEGKIKARWEEEEVKRQWAKGDLGLTF